MQQASRTAAHARQLHAVPSNVLRSIVTLRVLLYRDCTVLSLSGSECIAELSTKRRRAEERASRGALAHSHRCAAFSLAIASASSRSRSSSNVLTIQTKLIAVHSYAAARKGLASGPPDVSAARSTAAPSTRKAVKSYAGRVIARANCQPHLMTPARAPQFTGPDTTTDAAT